MNLEDKFQQAFSELEKTANDQSFGKRLHDIDYQTKKDALLGFTGAVAAPLSGLFVEEGKGLKTSLGATAGMIGGGLLGGKLGKAGRVLGAALGGGAGALASYHGQSPKQTPSERRRQASDEILAQLTQGY